MPLWVIDYFVGECWPPVGTPAWDDGHIADWVKNCVVWDPETKHYRRVTELKLVIDKCRSCDGEWDKDPESHCPLCYKGQAARTDGFVSA
jgi:hypothetical protein